MQKALRDIYWLLGFSAKMYYYFLSSFFSDLESDTSFIVHVRLNCSIFFRCLFRCLGENTPGVMAGRTHSLLHVGRP